MIRFSRNKEGDIAIGLIMILLIAVISMMLLIGLFATKLPSFTKGIYCKTFFHVYSKSFVPKGLRVDKSYCIEEEVLRVDLITNASFGGSPSSSLENLVNISIAAYAIGCWEQAEFGKLTKPLLCYELTTPPNMPKVTVTEAQVASILLQNRLCDVLPDNDIDPGCGTGNRLDFVKDAAGNPAAITVEGKSNILIEYNGSIILVS